MVVADVFQTVAVLSVIEALVLDLPAALGHRVEATAAEVAGGEIGEPVSLDHVAVTRNLPCTHFAPSFRVPRPRHSGPPTHVIPATHSRHSERSEESAFVRGRLREESAFRSRKALPAVARASRSGRDSSHFAAALQTKSGLSRRAQPAQNPFSLRFQNDIRRPSSTFRGFPYWVVRVPQ